MRCHVAYETAEDRHVALYNEAHRAWTFRPGTLPATEYPTEAAAKAVADRVRAERNRAGRVFVRAA